MALTKRACALLLEPQLVAKVLKAARAKVRGSALCKRSMVILQRQFWWWASTWDAHIVIAGFMGVCKNLYWLIQVGVIRAGDDRARKMYFAVRRSSDRRCADL